MANYLDDIFGGGGPATQLQLPSETVLDIAEIGDGQLLARQGTGIVGVDVPSGGSELTSDQLAALAGAGESDPPSGSNPFATIADLPSGDAVANFLAPVGGATVEITGAAPATGQVLQAVNATHASWATVASSGGSAAPNIFLDAPTSPNAYNDEFDSGSSDLAARGWRFTRGTTLMSRVGDVQWWTNPTLTTGEYRSTRLGSTLYLQLGSSTGLSEYFLSKPASGAGFYASRLSLVITSGAGSSSAAMLQHGFGVWGAPPASVAGAMIALWRQSSTWNQSTNWYCQLYTTAGTNDIINSGGGGLTYALSMTVSGINHNGASVGRAVLIDPTNGHLAYSEPRTFGDFAAPGYAGFYLCNDTSASVSPRIIAIDFVRKYPVDSFFGV